MAMHVRVHVCVPECSSEMCALSRGYFSKAVLCAEALCSCTRMKLHCLILC